MPASRRSVSETTTRSLHCSSGVVGAIVIGRFGVEGSQYQRINPARLSTQSDNRRSARAEVSHSKFPLFGLPSMHRIRRLVDLAATSHIPPSTSESLLFVTTLETNTSSVGSSIQEIVSRPSWTFSQLERLLPFGFNRPRQLAIAKCMISSSR